MDGFQTEVKRVLCKNFEEMVEATEEVRESGLRLLRPGQRVQLRMDGDRVSALTILTLVLPDDTSA